MRWEGQRESDNVEDRRGMGPARIGGVGIGGIVLVLAVSYFTGVNPLTLLNMLSGMQSVTTDPAGESVPTGPVNDKLGKFASVVLADTEQTWQQLLPKAGREYENPRLVLFTGGVHSACGTTSSAVGPFYCPDDHKVYLHFSTRCRSDSAPPAILHRRMSSPTRLATTYKIFLGSRRRSIGSSGKCQNPKATRSPFGWNCRPIVLPVCGAIMPTANGT